jgi:hypothetical protein
VQQHTIGHKQQATKKERPNTMDISPSPAPDPEPKGERSDFGNCPVCGKNPACRNIGRDHYFYCDEHKIAWCVGSNLFSSWRDESEDDWQHNRAKLADFKIIDESDASTPEQRKAAADHRRLHEAWTLRRDEWLRQHATEIQSYLPNGFAEQTRPAVAKGNVDLDDDIPC